jgi:hypothetical protein
MHARKNVRRRKGSAITEFGPALFFLLVIIFFPMMDILAMACQYCMGWYANFATCRELTVRKQSEGVGTDNTVQQEVYAAIKCTGVPAFLGVASIADLSSTAVYPGAAGGQQPMVVCTTIMSAKPFISVPWFMPVPGLNAPMVIQFQSTRPREVTQ